MTARVIVYEAQRPIDEDEFASFQEAVDSLTARRDGDQAYVFLPGKTAVYDRPLRGTAAGQWKLVRQVWGERNER